MDRSVSFLQKYGIIVKIDGDVPRYAAPTPMSLWERLDDTFVAAMEDKDFPPTK